MRSLTPRTCRLTRRRSERAGCRAHGCDCQDARLENDSQRVLRRDIILLDHRVIEVNIFP